ncbi:MAG TPA: hypothetical protein VFL76_02880 [Edaphocola sp.]|nr:hypothetical protein [Edaphocola sp.]
MAQSKFWHGFQKMHFYLLTFLLLQFLVDLLSGYRLHQMIIFCLTLALYASGTLLFSRNLSPFRAKALYYAFYTLPVLSLFLMQLFGGILVAVASAFTLYPVYPKEIKYETPKIRLYSHYQGFMSRCCNYEVVQPKALIFEKYLGRVQVFEDHPALKTARFILTGKDTLAYYPAGGDPVMFLKME